MQNKLTKSKNKLTKSQNKLTKSQNKLTKPKNKQTVYINLSNEGTEGVPFLVEVEIS